MIKPKKSIENLRRLKDFGNDRTKFVRMDKNERTVPFTDEETRGMLASITADLLPMYPDQTPLYRKLSSFLKVPQDCLLLSAGSDAAIKMIYETYVSPGDEILFLDPTYAMIEVYADMFEARKVKVGYSPDLRLKFEDLMSAITNRTRVVFIANPNQPTGTTLTPDQISSLLEKTRVTETLLVFDEAYQQFSDQPSVIRFIKDHPQVIVTQTFSKALGLASLRLGFLVSSATNIDWLYRVKTLADINMAALKLGEYLLDHYEIVERYVKSVRESKELLSRELKKLDIECLLGEANFIHLRFPKSYDLDAIAKTMKEKGYLIRTTGSGLPAVLEGCIRLTVGSLEQTREFLRSFLETISHFWVGMKGNLQ